MTTNQSRGLNGPDAHEAIKQIETPTPPQPLPEGFKLIGDVVPGAFGGLLMTNEVARARRLKSLREVHAQQRASERGEPVKVNQRRRGGAL